MNTTAMPDDSAIDRERQTFESVTFNYYLELKAKGWSGEGEGDSTLEALFWRRENGRYGVHAIEQAWCGWLLRMQHEKQRAALADFLSHLRGEMYDPWFVPVPRLPEKVPNMAVHGLAGEIVEALLADETDGGYDLTAGMFGSNFSALVRRWAQLEWTALVTAAPDKAEVSHG